MTIRTEVVGSLEWTDDQRAQIQAKVRSLADPNFDPDFHVGAPGTPESITYSRAWPTIEAANAWIDFLNTFDPPPRKARVVTE